MASEVFGEAEIILRGRLDHLQRDLDQAELLVVQQQQRIQSVQQETASTARTASQESEKSGNILNTLGTVVGAWKLAGIAIKGATTGLMLIPAVAAAAKVALIGLAVGGVLIFAAALGKVIEATDNTTKAIADSVRAARELDGTTNRVRGLAQELEKIPIVGGMVSRTFRIFSGDAEVADQALLRFVGRVEDGQVKVGGFRAALARAFGAGNLVDDIKAANEAMAEMNATMAARAAVADFANPQSRRLDDAERAAARANELEGVTGIQRVAIENRIRHEDAMRAFEDERLALRRNTNEILRQVGEWEKTEDITARRARIVRAALQSDLAAQEANIDARKAVVSDELTQQAEKRNEATRAEAAEAERIARAELDRLQTMTRIVDLRIQGRDAEADMAEIMLRRDEALAGADGNERQIEAINSYYDAVAALREQRNQQELAAEEEKIDKRTSLLDEQIRRQRELQEAESKRVLSEEARRQDDLASLRSQGRQALLRLAGRDDDAEDEALQSRFRQQIEAARRAGDLEKADLLERLRDVEQQDLDRRQLERSVQRGSDARARQIDTARDFIGGTPSDPKAEEKEMVKEQKKTNEQLRRLTTGARAA